ncbi:DUF3108 domain-containing protein [Algoriphagus sp. D3-2-R+10]|uniref:DUF3108 domain-containing protein n=1 Tax=Algoriphagus aurantiacus TaxID=3103948 RepID=UPI002B3E8D33|nr:DUF3108 domain-containing protein [Algoriphagus sp. D3-2-R+10]MEB2777747.1 DUF3108 domain-containing protein [Algoriphagus sp. D3-2-R+10]
MKRILGSLILLIILTHSDLSAQDSAGSHPFTYGEELSFEVSYGWLNLAEAKLQIAKRPQDQNDKPHYKIDVYGKTKGAATIFGKVNDNWGTYLDGETMLPSLSYRHIEEGKYRKHEFVHFDQRNKKATMKLFDRENRNLKQTKDFDLPGQVQDLVSGFYFLRSQDLKDMKQGESIEIRGFFDKEIYNIKLIYEGTETLDTNLGEKETYIFSPQLPKNKLFRGEFPVKVWVTKDQNKIPVKIKANLFIGSLNLDIISAKGLKNN